MDGIELSYVSMLMLMNHVREREHDVKAAGKVTFKYVLPVGGKSSLWDIMVRESCPYRLHQSVIN
jgi:hypothetical protein